MAEDFNNSGSFGPSTSFAIGRWVVDGDKVPTLKQGQLLGSYLQPVAHLGMAFGKSLLSHVSLQAPLSSGLISGRMIGEMIPQLPAQQDLSWAEASKGVWTVPM